MVSAASTETVTPGKLILSRMLERLYAAMRSGPAMNCRPHASRQRVDLVEIAKLDGSDAAGLVAELLGPGAAIRRQGTTESAHAAPADLERNARQEALLRKLRTITEDAATFEQEHGTQALFVGFPLLSVPPRRKLQSQRIIAPIGFIPVRISLKRSRKPSVEISCAGQGADRVVPNPTLFAWLEQQSGTRFDELFADDDGEQPWQELSVLTKAVFEALDLPVPRVASDEPLRPVPRSEELASEEPGLLHSAVLGLYPLSNQSLVRDTQAMLAGEPTDGPIRSFLDVGEALVEDDGVDAVPAAVVHGVRAIAEERMVTVADPCQARAVRLARSARGLVVHGPPGTGKSQTITNIVGDHLALGQRVLLVCDKRTALDVVHYRLEHLGLGDLCAVVHDAQRDHRDLYMGIRQQLDGLPEAKTDPRAGAALDEIDAELAALHDELTSYHHAVAERPEGLEGSFHELVGEWLALEPSPELVDTIGELAVVTGDDLRASERGAREVLRRGIEESYGNNPWREALDIELTDYLGEPVDRWRRALETLTETIVRAEALADANTPPFTEGDVLVQGKARAALADALRDALADLDDDTIAHWATASPATRHEAAAELESLAASVEVLQTAKPDPELTLATREADPPLAELGQWLNALMSYVAIARKWWSFLFFFTRRRRAVAILDRFGLAAGAEPAERLAKFVSALRARALLAAWHERRLSSRPNDEVLITRINATRRLLAALDRLDEAPLASIADVVRTALAGAERARILEGLARSEAHAEAIAAAEEAMPRLLSAAWRRSTSADLRRGVKKHAVLKAMESRFSTIEGILRLRATLKELPASIAPAVEALTRAGADEEGGLEALRHASLAARIRARLNDEPVLSTMDATHLAACHSRYRELEQAKRQRVAEVVRQVWTNRQRERLLASTGSRLNGDGTAVRRRLMLRGEKAMKVRQAIAAGAEIPGGDPLFDLRPVWMASPTTVAQIFPRAPIFDVVIFDEASQCRLEEALPVLLRARRVVIAGDPKQLPPTRFFESTLTESQSEEADGDQALFEEQQAEIDDLLAAALNLQVEQSYLDVHYRSRNADLIGFSNQSFYEARLQAIPGHPNNRATQAPLRLVQVHGTYEERANQREADEVVAIVRRLLDRDEPPSIGVVSLNLTQRDLIVEALDKAASCDANLARRLDEARQRRGRDSFEGLFVRNLESVQGDERDHIIVSTTYGPDREGRFFRRFGPLGRAGGGRRLNVLITRAREAIHLVTSIPPEIYRSAPPIEPGKQPNGAWHLFAYLRYAEDLDRFYREDQARPAPAEAPSAGVYLRPTATPSKLSETLACELARDHGFTSDVYWGNDGFCVDIALHHPSRAESVTVGVLCDGTRFDKTDDPVEWDVFRTAVLEGQGWELARVSSPEAFRDRQRCLEAVAAAARATAPVPPEAPLEPEPRTLH